jgi:hypothetical protein
MKKIWLCLVITLCLPCTVCFSGWQVEEIVSEKNFFNWRTYRGIAVDTDSVLHVAYGGDNLYHASHNGSDWTLETVDGTMGSGYIPTMLAAENGDLHIVYLSGYKLWTAYKPFGTANWELHQVKGIGFNWYAACLDNTGQIHIAAQSGGEDLRYYTGSAGTWTEEIIFCGGENGYSCSIDTTSTGEPIIFSARRTIIGYGDWGEPVYGENIPLLVFRDNGIWVEQELYAAGNTRWGTLIIDSQDYPHLFLIEATLSARLLALHWTGITWRVDAVESDTGLPSARIDTSDNIHLVYGMRHVDDLKYAVYDGMTWSIETIESGTSGKTGCIDVMPDGEPVAVYFTYPDLTMTRSPRNGGSWPDDTFDSAAFDSPSHGEETIQIALAGTDTPHVGYIHQYRLYHAAFTGTEWITEEVTSARSILEMIIDDSDAIHVCFLDYGETGDYTYGLKSGSAWSFLPIPLDEQKIQAMTIGTDGHPWVTAYDYRDGILSFMHYDGSNWLSDSLGYIGEYVDVSSITADGSGQAHICYHDAVNSDLIYAVGFDGAWSVETVDGTTGFRGYSNSIVLDATDEPFISYGGSGLQLARKDGSSWTIHEQIAAFPHATSIQQDNSDYPHIAGENIYAYWTGTDWMTDRYDSAGTEYADLALDSSDQPHIVYVDEEGDLRYIYKTPDTPHIDSVTPSSFYMENDYPGVTVSGTNLDTVLELDFGRDIRIESWTADSDIQITAAIRVYPLAKRGMRHVSVAGPDGEAVCEDCIELFYGPPGIDDLHPPGALQDQTTTILINGVNFESTSAVDFGDGITVNTFEVLYNQCISVDLTVDAAATTGFRDVSVTTPAGNTVCTECFEVGFDLGAVYEFAVGPVPDRLFANVPFTLRVEALDYLGYRVSGYSEDVTIYDTISGNLSPSTIALENGLGHVEAILAEPVRDDIIYATNSSRNGESNPFDVARSIANCSYEYISQPAESHDGKGFGIADDGTIWMVFGTDSLWAIRSDGDQWERFQVDDTPGAGRFSDMALGPDGLPHAIYTNRIPSEMRYARFNGYGWETECVFENAGLASIDVDHLGNPHICYGDLTSQKYAVRQNGEWIITELNDDWGWSDIAVDLSGNPHMTWYGESYSNLYYYGYLEGAWVLDNVGHNDRWYPAIDTDSTNSPHIIGGRFPYTFKYVYRDEGAWKTDELPGTENNMDAFLYVDSSDALHIGTTYFQSIERHRTPRYMHYNGVQWSQEDFPATEDNLSVQGFSMDGDGVGYFKTGGANPGFVGQELLTWDGSNWTREAVDKQYISAYSSNLLLTASEQPAAFWCEFAGFDTGHHNFSIKMAQKIDGHWQEDTITEVSDVFASAVDAQIGSDGAYRVAVFSGDPENYSVTIDYGIQESGLWNWEQASFYQDTGTTISLVRLALDSQDTPWIAWKVYHWGSPATIQLRVAHKSGSVWETEILESGDLYEMDFSLAMDNNDEPGIAYVKEIAEVNHLCYAHHSGSGWAIEELYTPTVLDRAVLAYDAQDRPHILFGDHSVNELKCLWKDDTEWVLETVEDRFSFAPYVEDIYFDTDDRLHCSYWDGNEWVEWKSDGTDSRGYEDTDLLYAFRENGVWQNYTADSGIWMGEASSLVVDSDYAAHFIYRDRLGEDLKYARCELYGPPIVDFVEPASDYPGNRIDSIAIYGIDLYPVTLIDFGNGIVTENLLNFDNSLLLADLVIDPDALPGPRDVRVAAPTGEFTCQDCFVVLEQGNLPVINSISPGRVTTGDDKPVLIEGLYLTDTYIADFGQGIDVQILDVPDDEHVLVAIEVSYGAEPGYRDVSVTNLHGEGICPQCLIVDYTDPPIPTPTPTPTGPSPTPTTASTRTPTPTPTFSGTAPPTSPPSSTPTPTPPFTPTPVHSYTPTPSGCTTTGVTVEMPLAVYHGGDTCWCRATVCNAEGNTLENYPLFIILDVYGLYFFAPSFNQVFDYYLTQYPQFPTGETVVEVLPPFTWPANVGSASGIVWYGALTNPAMTDLFGELSMFTFGWE